MTDVAAPLTNAELSRALTTRLASAVLWIGAFLSGFVIAEPAPYELFLVGVIAVWALLGLRFSATILPVLCVLLVFNIGGIIAMTQMDDWTGAPIYIAVSFFLAATAIFFAAVIEADHRRLRIIFAGYLAAATLTALLGVGGYFGVIPGGEVFTRFGRAMGVFQDPNVFAPYLALPVLYCLHTILTQPAQKSLVALPVLIILTLGVFLSFSRAGWGLYAFSMIMLVGTLLLTNQSGQFRLRVMVLSIVGAVALIIALIAVTQLGNVAEMLGDRARLIQSYDGARLGRFGRHIFGFEMAMQHPLGVGILQFAKLFGEDPHNVYLKAAFDYSWLGFAAYLILIVMTLVAGFKILLRERPWSVYFQCAYVVFVGHVLIGYVIDTDHWRHFFLLLGIIWGCIGLENRYQAGQLHKGR